MLGRFGKYLGLWQLDDRYFGGLFQFVFHDGIFEMIGNSTCLGKIGQNVFVT